MKTIINSITVMLLFIGTSFASDLNYKLQLTNINFTSENSVEFDIYLINTSESELFRYAVGQYFLDFNPGITKQGSLTLSIVKSELPESMMPSRIEVSGDQLRISVNPINSDILSCPLIKNDNTGTLIYRMKLETSEDTFSNKDLKLKWSVQVNGFTTKIAAYKNESLVEITNAESNIVQADNLENEIVQNNNLVPDDFSLSQNYPNPFNPSTKISYELPFDSKVSINLFDITGKKVASIIDEDKTAGYYTVNFNAANLPSGVYFYRISAESEGSNFISTKKMILLK